MRVYHAVYHAHERLRTQPPPIPHSVHPVPLSQPSLPFPQSRGSPLIPLLLSCCQCFNLATSHPSRVDTEISGASSQPLILSASSAPPPHAPRNLSLVSVLGMLQTYSPTSHPTCCNPTSTAARHIHAGDPPYFPLPHKQPRPHPPPSSAPRSCTARPLRATRRPSKHSSGLVPTSQHRTRWVDNEGSGMGGYRREDRVWVGAVDGWAAGHGRWQRLMPRWCVRKPNVPCPSVAGWRLSYSFLCTTALAAALLAASCTHGRSAGCLREHARTGGNWMQPLIQTHQHTGGN